MILVTKTTQYIAAVTLLAVVLGFLPLLTHAQGAGGDRPVRDGGVDFCENIDDAEAKALERIASKKADFDSSGNSNDKRAERLAERESKLEEKATARAEQYEKMQALADTDEKSAALDTFIETVDRLLADRDAVMQEAIEDFEDVIESLMSDRDSAVDDEANDIQEDIEAIFDTASDACDNGDTSQEVRTAFMEDMKALREEAKADRDEYSFKDELEAAKADRKAAMEAAQEAFKAGLDEAKTTLRAAFSDGE